MASGVSTVSTTWTDLQHCTCPPSFHASRAAFRRRGCRQAMHDLRRALLGNRHMPQVCMHHPVRASSYIHVCMYLGQTRQGCVICGHMYCVLRFTKGTVYPQSYHKRYYTCVWRHVHKTTAYPPITAAIMNSILSPANPLGGIVALLQSFQKELLLW